MPEPTSEAPGPLDRLRADVLALGARHDVALTGGQAARAHGLTPRAGDRLEVSTEHPALLADIAREIRFGLIRRGWAVTPLTAEPLAVSLRVTDRGDGTARVVDLLKERRWRPVAGTPAGPVLALEDVVGLRVSALHDHGLARDLACAIAASDRWSWTELEALGRRHARGVFDVTELQARLARAEWIDDARFAACGLDEARIARLRVRAEAWAADIAERLLEEAPYEDR